VEAVSITVGTVRLNIGSGDLPMRMAGWLNVDESPYPGVDLVLRVPPLPWESGTVSEIYAGHFLEHLERPEASTFLDECFRALVPGGRVGIMVPDTREVMRRYIVDEPAPMEWPAGRMRDLRDLDEMSEAIIYSTMQPSHHQWCWDKFTLSRAMSRAGFIDIGEFNRYHDPRVAVGAWYQVGVEGVKP
jgi:predicted SAM-dependent methyltransferase